MNYYLITALLLGMIPSCDKARVSPAQAESSETNVQELYLELEQGFDEGIFDTSITRLIAHPETYDGKKVRVVGVGNIAFESDGVFQNKDHWQFSVGKEALWVSLDYEALKMTPKEAEQLNGRYVYVEGKFTAFGGGHMGLWAGEIREVSRYELIGTEIAQQAGAGQPATAPESKSEGKKKPQPESEGRSR